MRALRWVLALALATGWLILLAGLFGSLSPLLDLASLVAVPVALLCLAAALGLVLLVRGPVRKGALGVLALAAGWVLLPPADAPASCAPDSPRWRIAWLNTQRLDDPAPIAAWLDREQPDVVAFAELDRNSHAVRSAVAARYPFLQSCLPDAICSTIIYARQQPVSSEPLARGDPMNRQTLSAARMVLAGAAGEQLNLMAVHLSRPLPLGRQRAELARLGLALEGPADTVIVGDFNATRRTGTLMDFAARNGFAPAAADGPTWPLRRAGYELAPVLQIDHVLVGRNWAVERLRVSEDLGSDHRGLVADLCRRG